MATNRTAQAARSIRYPVKLSRYSFDLLMTYLQTHKLLLPLGIINEHVNIQVYATSSSNLSSISFQSSDGKDGICWS